MDITEKRRALINWLMRHGYKAVSGNRFEKSGPPKTENGRRNNWTSYHVELTATTFLKSESCWDLRRTNPETGDLAPWWREPLFVGRISKIRICPKTDKLKGLTLLWTGKYIARSKFPNLR